MASNSKIYVYIYIGWSAIQQNDFKLLILKESFVVICRGGTAEDDHIVRRMLNGLRISLACRSYNSNNYGNDDNNSKNSQ